jgi:hypothetical protein
MAWSGISEKKGTESSRIVEMSPSAKEGSSRGKPRSGTAAAKNKDLQSGMELLELDFLLSIVEDTEGNDKNDVIMRKLNFNEILRREKQDHIDSTALAVYTVNEGNLYGKTIQCEATKELVRRTTN